MSQLETIEIETQPNCDCSVIWLHGLGADGHDFESIVPQLGLPETLKMRFIFPHAPFRAVTLNNGMKMRAWYDIIAIDPKSPEDREGIEQSKKAIEQLILRENERGVKTERIILAGFSQGGAQALYTGLRHADKLAGILALSTYLPFSLTLQEEKTSINQDIPIFMVHGMYDFVVPLPIAQFSYYYLVQAKYSVNWKTYLMQHAVCEEEISDISNWLKSLFS